MTAFTRSSCLVEMSIDSGVGQVDIAGYGVHGPLHAKCVVPAGCWRSSRPPSVSAKRAITRHSLDRCSRHVSLSTHHGLHSYCWQLSVIVCIILSGLALPQFRFCLCARMGK